MIDADKALTNYKSYLKAWNASNTTDDYDVDTLWTVISKIDFNDEYNLIIIKSNWAGVKIGKVQSIEKRIVNPKRDAKNLIFLHITEKAQDYNDKFCPFVHVVDGFNTPIYEVDDSFPQSLHGQMKILENRPLFLNEILEIIDTNDAFLPKTQYFNTNHQVVYISIEYNKVDYLLPCLPSGIREGMESSFFDEHMEEEEQAIDSTESFLSAFTALINPYAGTDIRLKRYSIIDYRNDHEKLNKYGIITKNDQFIKCSDERKEAISEEKEGEEFYYDRKLVDYYIQGAKVINTIDSRKIFIETFNETVKIETMFKHAIRRLMTLDLKLDIATILFSSADTSAKITQILRLLQKHFENIIIQTDDRDDKRKSIITNADNIVFKNINTLTQYKLVASNLVKNTTYRQYMINSHLYLDITYD